MNTDTFVKNLSTQQKAQLVHGKGSWHTNSVGNFPSIMMTDGPHGLRKQADKVKDINDSNKATCFPTACAVASSWNVSNAALVADSIASEAIAEDVSLVLGPGVNIKRSPLCGRNFEYFSEDPLLAGTLAAGYVTAMQSRGVGCSLKHFAVNSQETRRMMVNAIVDQRALREIYLSAFERVVKQAQPYTIMSAYNKLNGTSCTQNKWLLTDVLRNEWGFQGAVISDWGACYNGAEAIAAGMDLEMPSGGKFHEKLLIKAVEEGALAEEDLSRACTNVVNLVQKCNEAKHGHIVDYDLHHSICRQVENDCAVLLKNDGILPLKGNKKLLIVGEMAQKPRYQGAGSSHINTTCPNFLQVLEDNKVKHTYAQGYNVQGDKVDKKLQDQAVKLAAEHDVVLFFGGLTDDFEGEGYDRTKLDIPLCQQKLLAAIAKVNPKVVFVAFGGSPFTTPWLGYAKALLNMYLGGESVMESAYDLLFGKVSPSGRLAETFPKHIVDTPTYKHFANNDHLDEHRESIFVGYRYYNTFNVPVVFPFGYGLSYTKFEYSKFAVKQTDEGVFASVIVKNVGNVDGSDVVQIYVENCKTPIMRAKRELRGFAKVFVPKGQSVTVTVPLDERSFSVYHNGAFRNVKGTYYVCLCTDVNTVVASKKISVKGEALVANDQHNYPDYYVTTPGGFTVADSQFYALCGMQPPEEPVAPRRGEFTLLSTFGDMRHTVPLVRFVLFIAKRLAIRTAPSHRFSDPVAQMMYKGSLETPLISLMSVGGQSPKLVMMLLNNANKKHGKAFKALFGKYDI